MPSDDQYADSASRTPAWKSIERARHPAKEWRSRTRWGKFCLLVTYPADLLILLAAVVSLVVLGGSLLAVLAVAGGVVKAIRELSARWPATYKDGGPNGE